MKASIKKTATMTIAELHELIGNLIENEYGFRPTTFHWMDLKDPTSNSLAFVAQRDDDALVIPRFNPLIGEGKPQQ